MKESLKNYAIFSKGNHQEFYKSQSCNFTQKRFKDCHRFSLGRLHLTIKIYAQRIWVWDSFWTVTSFLIESFLDVKIVKKLKTFGLL